LLARFSHRSRDRDPAKVIEQIEARRSAQRLR
jgi:hypothetical protein